MEEVLEHWKTKQEFGTQMLTVHWIGDSHVKSDSDIETSKANKGQPRKKFKKPICI
jgi:hypothetical protein